MRVGTARVGVLFFFIFFPRRFCTFSHFELIILMTPFSFRFGMFFPFLFFICSRLRGLQEAPHRRDSDVAPSYLRSFASFSFFFLCGMRYVYRAENASVHWLEPFVKTRRNAMPCPGGPTYRVPLLVRIRVAGVSPFSRVERFVSLALARGSNVKEERRAKTR